MLKDKVIVLTGGAGFISQALARELVRQRAVVVLADIAHSQGEKCCRALREELVTDKVYFRFLELTNKDSLDELVSWVSDTLGGIDALVNNAYPRNANYGRDFWDVEYKDFSENLSLHLGGFFLACQRFGRYFADQGYGNIINMSSIYGIIAPRFEIYGDSKVNLPVEYAAIKAGLNHLSKYLAKYFKGKNIRVNCISPGGILRGQPQEFLQKYNAFGLTKGMLDREDIVGTLIFLLSDQSKYINGQNIIVDDGWSL